ncbi:hypothetical protein GOP47_0021423 [Adiantum capillus-veneris]|uniref:RING-type E3 ubiquitin transferase n=1 Tax=Adiantum capillus-veneris TaxID=13818 RepID=A0A9D4Z7U8_ADICA|nr:hypothetical protein GOP47_0021423 [Adiantum capillus-veneris]
MSQGSGNDDARTDQSLLQNDAPAESGSLPYRNSNISRPVSVSGEATEATEQSSPMLTVVGTLWVANAQITLEEHEQRALEPGNVTDTLPITNPHIVGPNEERDSPQEADMMLNMPIHTPSRAPVPSASHDHDEDATVGEVGIDVLPQRDFSTGAEEQQGEAPTEPVSIEEVPIETSHSPYEGTTLGIAEGAGPCTDDKTVTNNINSPKAPSRAEEEAHGETADGMNCPICMEPWTGEGIHRICCLACGHLFGRSCIRRWLNQRGKKNSKCPHCNRKARIEDIRNLYVPSLTVVDDKNQQLLEELGVLKSKNKELVVQNEKLRKDYQNLQAVVAARPQDMSRSKENFFTKRSLHTLQGCSSRQSYIVENQTKRRNFGQTYGMDTHKLQKTVTVNDNNLPEQFQLQEEFSLLGAKVFDMDAYSQMLLVAQKSTAVNGAFILNKISLLSLTDTLMMPLPPCTGAVRDIRVAPPSGKLPGRLALVASLGKTVSLFSLESNNVVLTYKLQSPCWSCAWDPDEPNYVFAGSQDGALTIFDLRQTSSPLRSLQSFCRQPVHTLHPINECNLPQGRQRNGVLTACSSGVYFWDSSIRDLDNSRPRAIACSDNSGICVAVAYNHLANMAVATFRDKPSVHQAGSMNHTADAAFSEPNHTSFQPNTQLNLGFHPLRASHYPLVKSGCTPTSGPDLQTTHGTLQCEAGSSMDCGWKYGNPMFGNASPVGMHRLSQSRIA